MWPDCSDVGRTPVLQRSMVLSWLVKPEEDSPLEVMSTPRWGSYGSRGRWPVPHLHTTEEYIPFIHIIMEMSILYTTISVTKVGNKPTNLFSFFLSDKREYCGEIWAFCLTFCWWFKKKKKEKSGRERCDQAPCCEEEPPTQQIFPLEDSVFLQAQLQIQTHHNYRALLKRYIQTQAWKSFRWKQQGPKPNTHTHTHTCQVRVCSE